MAVLEESGARSCGVGEGEGEGGVKMELVFYLDSRLTRGWGLMLDTKEEGGIRGKWLNAFVYMYITSLVLHEAK